MVKSRFSTLDVRRMVQSLKPKIENTWVQNIYDLNSKTFQFKLNVANQKQLLLIEAGVRFHTTEFNRPKANFPSGFSMKLRKHIRGKKLTTIDQVGFDRVVVLSFGKEDSRNYLFVELYSSGNVVLTDSNYVILATLRIHDFGEDNKIAVREIFPFKATVSELPKANCENLTSMLSLIVSDLKEKNSDFKVSFKEIFLHKLSIFSSLGKDLLAHHFYKAKIQFLDPMTEVELQLYQTDKLVELVYIINNSLEMFTSEPEVVKGYIVYSSENEEDFESFENMKFLQQKENKIKETSTFEEAVDEYFSKLETQKLKKQNIQYKKQAMKRVDKVKNEQDQRLKQLDVEIIQNEDIAKIILDNCEIIEQALLVIRSCIANQMSWENINDIVQQEKANKNEIASIIRTLKLDSNEILVQLPKEIESKILTAFTIDISLSAQGNATKYYSFKKKALSKVEKTKEVSERLVKVAEKKANEKVSAHSKRNMALSANIGVARKSFWFEKFHWCFTRHGFLVLAGKDASQNELLVKRYLRKDFGDLFVHADFHGASTCILRNKTTDSVIDPESLREAGLFAVCRSSVWSGKGAVGSYYVSAEQVSKTAPTGEYLTQGSFMIRGKRTFLPPERLELGFGFIFKLDETQPNFEERPKEWRELEIEEEYIESINEPSKSVVDEVVVVGSVVLAEPKVKQWNSRETVDQERTTKVDEKQRKELPRGKKTKMKRLKKKLKNKTDEEKEAAFAKFGLIPTEDETKDDTEAKVENKQADSSSKDTTVAKNIKKHEKYEELKQSQEKPVLDDINIAGFTAKPSPDDVLLYAIPFCGPLSSMAHFQYRVKLVPGTSKKGKATRLATQVVLNKKDAPEREQALIQAVDENLSIQVIPGNVKVAAAGISKLSKKKKKKKK